MTRTNGHSTSDKELRKQYESLWFTENGYMREDLPELMEEVWEFINSERERWGLEMMNDLEKAWVGKGFLEDEDFEEIRERMRGGSGK